MTPQVPTIKSICEKFHVSEEQFGKATWCSIDGGQGFYIVECDISPVEFHVYFNRDRGKLTCTCPVGQQRYDCWHERASLASEEHYKATEHARRLAEQAEAEATPEYQFEQALHECEQAIQAFDRATAEFNAIMRAAGIF
jgi:hypothetical protein